MIVDKIRDKLSEFTIKPRINDKSDIDDQINMISMKVSEVENEIEGLIDKMMLPDTDKTTLKYINSRISKLDKEKSELLDDIKKLKLDKQKKSSLNHKVLRDAMSKWDELSFDDKRSVIEVLIEKILVFPDKVEIHWKV